MADLVQADAVQQLEVVLMGSLAAQVIDLLSEGLRQTMASTSISTSAIPAQPSPRIYTSTPPALPPSSVPVLEISTTSPTPAAVPAMTTSSGGSALPKTKLSKTSDDFPCQHNTPTPVGPSSLVSTILSSSSTSVAALSLL